MGYEAHIAGLGDQPLGQADQGAAIRFIKRRSAAEIAERRAAVVAAVREVAPVPIVNGGGTGSIHTTRREDVITEITAGSASTPPPCSTATPRSGSRPRRCSPCPWCGGRAARWPRCWAAATQPRGPPGADRLPTPHLPRGLRVDPLEGAGEVQTPVTGSAAASLRVGANVYLRHAKAGELCERFNSLYLVRGGEIADEVPTYRGEGRCEL